MTTAAYLRVSTIEQANAGYPIEEQINCIKPYWHFLTKASILSEKRRKEYDQSRVIDNAIISQSLTGG